MTLKIRLSAANSSLPLSFSTIALLDQRIPSVRRSGLTENLAAMGSRDNWTGSAHVEDTKQERPGPQRKQTPPDYFLRPDAEFRMLARLGVSRRSL